MRGAGRITSQNVEEVLYIRERGISFPGEAAAHKRIRRFAGVVRTRFLETSGGGESTATGPNDFFNGLIDQLFEVAYFLVLSYP